MKRILLTLLSFTIIACDNTDLSVPLYPEGTVFTSTDFSEYPIEWTSGFSDYSTSNGDFHGFSSGVTRVPGEFEHTAFLLRGNNVNVDVFMFLKHQVEGLEPDSEYRVYLTATVWSNVAKNCVDTGGARGESVYIKAGASTIEPEQADYYMNIDIGNQSQGGANAAVLGDIAVDGLTCYDIAYREKTYALNSQHNIKVTADDEGKAWVLIGSDSGYEGETTLYYDTIDVLLIPSDAATQ